MAKQSSVNLDITKNSDGFDITGGTTPRTLTFTGGNATITGSGSAVITFPSSSSTLASLALSETLSNKTLDSTCTFLSTPTLLSTTTGIDLKTTGQTTLYTVPGGKTLVITDVIIYLTNGNTITVAAIVRVGKTAAFNQYIDNTTLTGLSATGNYLSLGSATTLEVHSVFDAADVVKLDVTTGATATTDTVTVYVFGFLF